MGGSSHVGIDRDRIVTVATTLLDDGQWHRLALVADAAAGAVMPGMARRLGRRMHARQRGLSGVEAAVEEVLRSYASDFEVEDREDGMWVRLVGVHDHRDDPRHEAATIIRSILDRVGIGELEARDPRAVALVRWLQGAVVGLEADAPSHDTTE